MYGELMLETGDTLNCDQRKVLELFAPILRMVRESEITAEAAGRHVRAREFGDLYCALYEARGVTTDLYEDKDD